MKGTSYLCLFFFIYALHLNAQQGVQREIYSPISGNELYNLTNDTTFPWSPSSTEILTTFEHSQNHGDNYGARIRGYITIPQDGTYQLFLSCDDHGELYLGFDGKPSSKQLVAHVKGWTPFRVFNKYSSQTSKAFNLKAGQVIYAEALFKEEKCGDHLTVGWSINNGETTVISSEHLTPFFYDFNAEKAILSESVSNVEALHNQSTENQGTELGEYSQASLHNFQQAINSAKNILDTEKTNGRNLAQAKADLDKATEIFTGGIKPSKLNGIIFGSTPSWLEGREFDKAMDGDITTFFDFMGRSDSEVGLDLGEGNETAVLTIKFHPRFNQTKRMINAKFQGSLDGTNYTTLHTVNEEPEFAWNTLSIVDATSYRYYRLLSPTNSHGNVAEVEFHGLQNQELYLKQFDYITAKANTANQVISYKSLTADHGGLLPEFITFTVLTLPIHGQLKLNGVQLEIEDTFTQADLNNGILTYSADSSRENDSFSVEISDSIGGQIDEVLINITIDSDLDGLSDTEEISLGTNFDNADTNNNGIKDGWEHLNGLDPTTDTLSPLVEEITGENGLVASYIFDRFSKTSEFANRSPMKVTKISQINFGNSYSGQVGNSGQAHNVGAKFQGYIYIPIEGNYKFTLTSDDGSKLFINGIEIITNDGLHSFEQVSGTINLSAGLHQIRCEYFEAGGRHGCILEWEGPGRPRSVIPASYFYLSKPEYEAEVNAIDSDQDGLTDNLELNALTDPKNPDTDGDKLLDGEEYHALHGYKTDGTNVDTDADTVSDYDEIFVFKSNPLVPDFDGSTDANINIIPAQTSSRLGKWLENGNSIYALNRRGYVEYTVDITYPGFYRTEALIKQHNLAASTNNMEINFFVDEEYITSQKTDVSNGPVKTSFLTPYLKAGKHTIRFYWNNVYYNTSLQIDSIIMTQPGGPDNNGNGRADWVDNYLSQVYSLDGFSATSAVSPAQIEGKGIFLKKMSVSNSQVQPGTQNRWYTNISLNQGAPTNFTVEFEEGLLTTTGSITWSETNVFNEDELTIHKGSSLLLNAVDEENLESTFKIVIGSEEFEITPETPIAYQFNKAGEIQVNAIGGSETKTLTVNVVEVPNVAAPFLWRSKARQWNWEGLPEEAILEADGLEFNSRTAGGYTLRRTEAKENIYIVARLGENGPIVNTVEAKTFWLKDGIQGFDQIIERYEDNSVKIADTVFGFNIPKGMEIQLRTISGVTFEDGNRTKILTKDDFNELDQWTLILIKSADRLGAGCHWYKVIQDGVLVGEEHKE